MRHQPDIFACRHQQRPSGFFGGRAPVTTVILIANLIMFAISWMATAASVKAAASSILWGMGGEALYRLGESYPPAIFEGHEWYRLVTAMFLHGGLISHWLQHDGADGYRSGR